MYLIKRIFCFLSLLSEAKGGKMAEKNCSNNYNYRVEKQIKLRGAVRALCLFLCAIMLLVSLVGCTPYESSEELATLSNSLESALSELEALKNSYDTVQEELDKLKEDNKSDIAELEDLKNSYSASQDEISSLKNSIQSAKQELDVLKQSNQSSQQEIDSLKQSNQSLQQEIDSLKQSNQSSQQEIDSLKQSNNAAHEEIASLEGDNAAMQEEIDSLKKDNEAALQEIEKLKAQIEELKNSIASGESLKKIKIYIDQGHNPTSYHNTGASGNGLYEQDLTYTVGILLAELLEEDGRFDVCLSRPTADTVLGTDNSSSLDARVQGAKAFGADYFISLHVNSYTDSSVTGIEVYTAEDEGEAYDLGDSILQGLVDSTGLQKRGMKQNPDFYVLKNAAMPAALLEMGFISNSSDAALLSQRPDLFAQGIYNGILTYFEAELNVSPIA